MTHGVSTVACGGRAPASRLALVAVAAVLLAGCSSMGGGQVTEDTISGDAVSATGSDAAPVDFEWLDETVTTHYAEDGVTVLSVEESRVRFKCAGTSCRWTAPPTDAELKVSQAQKDRALAIGLQVLKAGAGAALP